MKKKFIKNKNYILYNIIFIFLAIIPILPSKLKGISVFSFILLALFSLKQKKRKFNRFYLINMGLYMMYVISLFYSDTLKVGTSMLETTLSLLIFPIGFMLFSGNTKAITYILNSEFFVKYIFIFSSFLLSILIFLVSFQFGDYFNRKINLELLVNKLNTGFYWLKDHPIYLSIYLSVSLLMICSLFNKSNQKNKIILIIIGFFKFFILLLMARKGVIISLFISVFLYFLMTKKRKIKIIVLTVFITLLSTVIMLKLIPDTSKRFMKVFDSKSYREIKSYSSTSIRYGIYKCTFYKIHHSWALGYGVGDVKKELNKCYKKTSNILSNGKYNSHNQYLGILLYVGVLGLSVFLISLLINLKIFYINKDYFAFCLLLMFMSFMLTENILDRQNGVILFSFLLNFYSFKNTHLE